MNSVPTIQYVDEMEVQYYPEFANKKLSDLNGDINLTSRYRNGSGDIGVSNKLIVNAIDTNINYVNFVIN